ncbi:hypothetical protein BDQ17DRAFT_1333049 [Cyathus striatus]|nr:hypothetical protein BDQ17DRAFT_1333049 [Cyathus striatus]
MKNIQYSSDVASKFKKHWDFSCYSDQKSSPQSSAPMGNSANSLPQRGKESSYLLCIIIVEWVIAIARKRNEAPMACKGWNVNYSLTVMIKFWLRCQSYKFNSHMIKKFKEQVN